jgi:hypothetical protein
VTGMEWAALLGVAGASGQVAGVVLVLRDLRDARRLALQAQQREERVRPVGVSILASSGDPSSLDSRVTHLEKVADYILNHRLPEAFETMAKSDELSLLRDDDLRALIKDLAGGHLSRRVLGAGLVIIGTAAVLAGSIFVLVATF